MSVFLSSTFYHHYRVPYIPGCTIKAILYMQEESKSFAVQRLFLTPSFWPKSDQDFKALCKAAIQKAVVWVSGNNLQHFLFLFCKGFFHVGARRCLARTSSEI